MKEMVEVVELPLKPIFSGTATIHAIVTHPVFVYFSMIAAPFGCIFIWLKPNWSMKKKWILTGVEIALMVFGFVGTKVEERQLRNQLQEANILWESGNQPVAVVKYLDLIKNQRNYVETNIETLGLEHGPMIFGRTIDHFISVGDSESAAEILAIARKNRISPSISTQESKEFLIKK